MNMLVSLGDWDWLKIGQYLSNDCFQLPIPIKKTPDISAGLDRIA